MLALGLVGLGAILSELSIVKIINVFSHARFRSIVFFLLSSLGVMTVFTVRWMLIIHAQGHKVPFFKLFAYRVCGYGIGTVTPSAKTGGEPIRVMLLKKHGIPMKDRLFSVLTDKILEVSANFIFFVSGLILILINFSVPRNTEFLMLFLILVFGFLIFMYYFRMIKGRDFFASTFRLLKLDRIKRLWKVERNIVDMERIMIDYYHNHLENFIFAFILSLFAWVFSFLEIKYALQIVGIDGVNLGQIFIILSFIGLAFLIPIPMSLGSLEALQISTFSMMQFQSAPAAVGLSFMIRARDLMYTIFALAFMSKYGLGFTKIIKRSFSRVDEEIKRVRLSSGEEVDIRIKRRR